MTASNPGPQIHFPHLPQIPISKEGLYVAQRLAMKRRPPPSAAAPAAAAAAAATAEKQPWLRPWLLQMVESGYPLNVKIQHAMGVTPSRPQGHYAVTKFFKIAAALGTEVTFILGLPLVFWIVDTHLGVRMVALWGLTYYIGQVCNSHSRSGRRPIRAASDTCAYCVHGMGFPFSMLSISPTCLQTA